MKSYECDVLVIGSGAGGLSTAVTAKHLKLDVLVVEKEPLVGGTTARSGGFLWVPGNPLAAKEGMPEGDVRSYLKSVAGNFYDERRVEAFLDGGPRMIDFFQRHTAVQFGVGPGFADYHTNLYGAVEEGRSIFALPFLGNQLGKQIARLAKPLPETLFMGFSIGSGSELKHFFNATSSLRSAAFVARRIAGHFRDVLQHGRDMRLVNGQALAARLFKSALDRKIPIWNSAPAMRLIESDGRIIGAEIGGEKPTRVMARKAVVLACGGFPHDRARQSEVYPKLIDLDSHISLAPTGNTGDGIRLAEEIGASLGEVSQPAAWTPASRVPRKDGTTGVFPHFIDRGKPGIIAVTSKGRRFVNESESYHVFVQAMVDAKQDSLLETFFIADHRAIRKYGLGSVKPYPVPLSDDLRFGYLKKGKTIEELARVLGIDERALVDTINTFNANARSGHDPVFHRGTSAYNRYQGDLSHKPNPSLAPLETGPFYAVKIETGDIATFMGLRTSPSAEVLREDGTFIPGLYAVGTDMGSVFGGGYPGAGANLGPAMTFGFVAAHHIAGASLPDVQDGS